MIIKKGKSQVTFVFQPFNDCKQVQVAGSFNNWKPEEGRMTRQKNGSFRRRFQLPPGEYRYRFVVDGQWQADPEADGQVPNPFGSMDSVVWVQ